MLYLVIELQKNNGQLSTLTYSYDNLRDAESKYYSLLSVAAKSSIEKFAVSLLNENGRSLKSEFYTTTDEKEVIE